MLPSSRYEDEDRDILVLQRRDEASSFLYHLSGLSCRGPESSGFLASTWATRQGVSAAGGGASIWSWPQGLEAEWWQQVCQEGPHAPAISHNLGFTAGPEPL